MHHHPRYQPSPHDILVEPPAPPAPSAAALTPWLEGLRDGSRTAPDATAWAEEVLSRHVFPTTDADDAQARLGEAVMQLSMLDRVPLSGAQLAAMQAFVAGTLGWSAWLDALA